MFDQSQCCNGGKKWLSTVVLTDEVVAVVWALLTKSAPMPDSTWRIIFYHHNHKQSTQHNCLALLLAFSYHQLQRCYSTSMHSNNAGIAFMKKINTVTKLVDEWMTSKLVHCTNHTVNSLSYSNFFSWLKIH